MTPVIAADGASPIIWRVACDIAGLIGCGFGPATAALRVQSGADVLVLGDLTPDRMDQALQAGFRFGVEASVTPYWLARVLQFLAKPRALMAWCFTADSYRAFSLNQILLKQLPEAHAMTSARCLDLDLLLTESIANTIDHGAPPPGVPVTPSFGLFISAHDEGLELAVVQAGDGPDDPDGLLGRMQGGVPALDGESGRGLFLIAEMARFAWFEEEGRCLRFVVARQ